MYQFKQLKAKYNFASEVTNPLGVRSTFSKVEQIRVLPNLIEGLNFTLYGATEESINGCVPQGFDLIMSRLGQSLFPVELQVLKTGKIKCIKNYDAIKSRWQDTCNNILTSHKRAFWVERYINMTTKNLATEKIFMDMLVRNNFVQMLFMEEAASQQNILICDFPFSGSTLNVIFHITRSAQMEYHYKSTLESVDERICSGNGEIRVVYSEKGLPRKISFIYRIEVATEGFYTKRIVIELVESK